MRHANPTIARTTTLPATHPAIIYVLEDTPEDGALVDVPFPLAEAERVELYEYGTGVRLTPEKE